MEAKRKEALYMKRTLPFQLSKEQSFYESLNEWIGDVLFDELPEKGFELRDEQVFMAFQIEKALREKNVLFAEAGVGTGKTIGYLLPTLAYARYTGKPAIIACADETLIDQLVKEDGDIAKMSEALGLEIDVRLAKSRDQYVCLNRLEEAVDLGYGEFADSVEDRLPLFVYGSDSLAELYPYGDRADYPELSDEQWQMINYHPIQQCGSCEKRNRCGQTLHRKSYREATDFIICSQDFYMEHIWTKTSRIRQEQLPLLPESSVVVFDEGHLLEYAAQQALTYEVQGETLITLLERVMKEGVREETLEAIDALIETHDAFFAKLTATLQPSTGFRYGFEKTDLLKQLAHEAVRLSEAILEEFVFDSGLYTIDSYNLKMVEEYLEQYIYSMTLLIENKESIDWVEDREGEWTLVIMPRLVTNILREQLFTNDQPIIFSSATLSTEGDFTYIASSLGIDEADSFTVDSPFDYEEVMIASVIEGNIDEKITYIESLLKRKEPTLILFSTAAVMQTFESMLPEEVRTQIAFEGERELASMIRDFTNGQMKMMASYNLWEGLDLPEHRLTQVVIFDLPFPSNDPLFDAKRAHAKRPFEEVDLPYMQLRFRQGVGRLIRSSRDRGEVHILLDAEQVKYKKEIERLLPVSFKEKEEK